MKSSLFLTYTYFSMILYIVNAGHLHQIPDPHSVFVDLLLIVLVTYR